MSSAVLSKFTPDEVIESIARFGGIERYAALLSPAWFCKLAFKDYILAPHIELLDLHVLALLDKDDDQNGLLVSMPPRHGKSRYLSHSLPAWYLGNFPGRRVLLSSYEADFAASWGRKARDLVDDWGSAGQRLFEISVRKDVSAQNRWDLNESEGGMGTAGVMGALTGKGADLLIIDDPVKNAEEALSETYRNKAWDWFISTAETRLEPGGKTILIQTRWHEDDLYGRIEQEINAGDRKGWAVVRLPAIADADDPLGRPEGDALFPERYPIEKLEEIRDRQDADSERLGPYWWSALYQQSPSPREGGFFKLEWFRRYKRRSDGYYELEGNGGFREANLSVFLTVDLAVSTKETADWTVIAAWAMTPKRDLILLDVNRLKIEGPDQVEAIREAVSRHRPSWITVERVAYQLALVQALRRESFPVREYIPKGDKVARAQSFAARMAGGGVYFPHRAHWLSEFERELMTFPAGRHDDQVDVCSIASSDMLAVAVPSVS